MVTELTVQVLLTSRLNVYEAVAAIAKRLDHKKTERYYQLTTPDDGLPPGWVRQNKFELYLYDRSIEAEGEIYQPDNQTWVRLKYRRI